MWDILNGGELSIYLKCMISNPLWNGIDISRNHRATNICGHSALIEFRWIPAIKLQNCYQCV